MNNLFGAIEETEAERVLRLQATKESERISLAKQAAAAQAIIESERESKTGTFTSIFSTAADSLASVFGKVKSASDTTSYVPGTTNINLPQQKAGMLPPWAIPAAIGGGLLLLVMKK